MVRDVDCSAPRRGWHLGTDIRTVLACGMHRITPSPSIGRWSRPSIMAIAVRPSPCYSCRAATTRRTTYVRVMAAQAKTSQIKVIKSAPENTLKSMGVRKWPTWGCGVSKFPWTYDSSETCYLLQGEVIVTPDGGEPVEIKAGDMATFPAGMSCTWDVRAPVNKHYEFS